MENRKFIERPQQFSRHFTFLKNIYTFQNWSILQYHYLISYEKDNGCYNNRIICHYVHLISKFDLNTQSMSVLCRQRITWMQNHISLTDRVTPHFWSHSLLYTLVTFDLDVTWPPPTTWCILIILFWNNACLLRNWKLSFMLMVIYYCFIDLCIFIYW